MADKLNLKIGDVIPETELYKFWQYSSAEEAKAAGFDFFIIVSYGKHGLTVRNKESRHSFVLVPKNQSSEEPKTPYYFGFVRSLINDYGRSFGRELVYIDAAHVPKGVNPLDLKGVFKLDWIDLLGFWDDDPGTPNDIWDQRLMKDCPEWNVFLNIHRNTFDS